MHGMSLALDLWLHGDFCYQQTTYVASPMLQVEGLPGVIAIQMMASTPGKWAVCLCVCSQHASCVMWQHLSRHFPWNTYSLSVT
jgi:hypothetical protein